MNTTSVSINQGAVPGLRAWATL